MAHHQEMAKENNVRIDYVLSTTWASEELADCPEWQEAERIVRNTPGIAVLAEDRDRLPIGKDGIDRTLFLYDLKEVGGTLLLYNGPPYIPDDDTAMFIEQLHIFSKRLSVKRAQKGSREGLKDRAVRDGLPTSYHPVFGYRWEWIDGVLHLVTTERWIDRKLIIDLTKTGKSQGYIQRELKHRGIPSPTGQPEWPIRTISAIQHDPISAGRYYSRQSEAVAPMKRRPGAKRQYGKSSQKRRNLEEAHYQAHIIVDEPCWTWEEREACLKRMEKSPQNSMRNARRSYRYGHHIFCDRHTGKRGNPQKLHGVARHGYKYYVCHHGKGCHSIRADGTDGIDQHLDNIIRMLIIAEGSDGRWLDQQNVTDTRDSLTAELKRLNTDRTNTINALATLEAERLMGRHKDEVYGKVKGQLNTKLAWVTERNEAVIADLDSLAEVDQAQLSWQGIVQTYRDRLDTMTDTEWRELLDMLGVEIHIPEDMTLTRATLKHTIPDHAYSRVEIKFGVPILAGKANKMSAEADRQLASIVGKAPCTALGNRHFPVRFTLSSIAALVEGGVL